MDNALLNNDNFDNFAEMLRLTPEIRARLADDESVALYDARLNFFWKRDTEKYFETVNAFPRKWQVSVLDSLYERFQFSSILLWGCRELGRHARGILAHSKYADLPMYFVSNTKKRWNTTISIKDGNGRIDTPVIGPDDILQYLDGCVILILTRAGRYSVMDQLSDLVCLPSYRVLFTRRFQGYYLGASRPNQYFDVFEAKPNEVFIDAGVLDGNTSLQFRNWCGGNYEKIIAFEPNPKVIKDCERCFATHKLTNSVIIPKAAWSREDELNFIIDDSYQQGGARVSESSASEKVPADSIDHVLGGGRATFIKMDIEGSEYQALLGAEQTIKKYHPRLAISLYHKPEDVLEIPYLLYKMNPDYRFVIRHYTSIMTETVLYAFDEE